MSNIHLILKFFKSVNSVNCHYLRELNSHGFSVQCSFRLCESPNIDKCNIETNSTYFDFFYNNGEIL
jgi:hypothetical protein